MAVNFVKFIRGTQAAYDRIVSQNAVDQNTLYFVYDKTAPQNGGLLYLGDTLIGGTGSGNTGVTTLARLSDVSVPNSISNGMLLQYNSVQQKWQAVSVESVIQNANISSADVYSGSTNENETVAQALSRIISNPKESDIAVIDNTSYVYDGSYWIPLMDSGILTRLATLETEVTSLQVQMEAVDGKIASAISNANHLTYKVLNAGQTINDVNPNSANLNKTIFLVPDPNGETGNSYKEYMFVNGNPELLGSFSSVNLDGYVTTTTLSTVVGNLNTSISNLQSSLSNYKLKSEYNSEVGDLAALRTATGNNNSTLVGEVVSLYERLQWVEMTAT